MWPHRELLAEPRRAEEAVGDSLLLDIGDAGLPLLLLAGACAAVSVLVRFVRFRGEERAQLEWLAYAAVVTVAFLTASEQLTAA